MVVDNRIITMLDLLSVTDMVDSIRVNADTVYEMDIVWNPNMNGGEFQCVTKESGYEAYVACKTAHDVARTINPMYLRVMDWVEEHWEDCDDKDNIVEEIVDNLWNNEHHWHLLTDSVISEYAMMLEYIK